MKTLFALVLTAMRCFGQHAPEGGSLLQDRFTKLLSFEDAHSANVLNSWVSIPQSTVAADNRTVPSGKWAARIERTSASPLPLSRLLYTTILSFKAQRIELRGWLRTENVNGFVGLWLRENGQTPNGQSKELASEDMRGQRVEGTTRWKEYSISLSVDPPVQPEVRVLYFGVVLSGTGKAWADDLQLLVDGKPLWAVAETTAASKPSLAAPVPKLRLEELTSLRSTTLHSRPPAYMVRIVILVDENSQSQSEYTTDGFPCRHRRDGSRQYDSRR